MPPLPFKIFQPNCNNVHIATNWKPITCHQFCNLDIVWWFSLNLFNITPFQHTSLFDTNFSFLIFNFYVLFFKTSIFPFFFLLFQKISRSKYILARFQNSFFSKKLNKLFPNKHLHSTLYLLLLLGLSSWPQIISQSHGQLSPWIAISYSLHTGLQLTWYKRYGLYGLVFN